MNAKELPNGKTVAAYQKVTLRMKDKPVIIRTLVGGDTQGDSLPQHEG